MNPDFFHMNVNINDVLNILSWILPVLLGAIIGYVTNAIAIRMLFRPLKEKRILGVKLPFTPGIIPKQRYKFSASIGKMVSDELITEETIRKQISKESFRNGVYTTVSNITESFLSNPEEFIGKERIHSLLDSLESSLSNILYAFLCSKFFIHMTRGLVEKLVGSTLELNLSSVAEIFKKSIKLKDHLHGWIESVLGSERTKSRVVGWIRGLFSGEILGERGRNAVSKDANHTRIIFSVFEFMGEGLKNFLPSILRYFFVWLRSEETHKVLEINGRFLLRDILDKLTPVQKLIISAGQFDRSIDEKMPEIVDEVLDYLEDFLYKSETIERIGNSVSMGLKEWYKKNKSSVITVDEAKEKKIEMVASDLYDLLIAKLKSANVSEVLMKLVDNLLEDYSDTKLYDIVVRKGRVDPSSLVDLFSNFILNIMTKRETALTISREIVNHFGFLFKSERRIDLKSYLNITEERKRGIDTFITSEILRLLDVRVVELIESIDVNTLVVEKIDGLDVESVESLLLKVIAEHLRWINIFGAILGALIGLTQLLLRFIG